MNPVQIYFVDDNLAFNESTCWSLEEEGFDVLPFHSARNLLTHLDTIEQPSHHACVVSDIRMPDISGIELIDQLWQKRIRLPVILISGHADVPLTVEAMQKGAAQVIEKPFDIQVLVASIQVTTDQPLSQPRNPDDARSRIGRLTPRERQVLDLVCAGKLNKTIAGMLGISVKTVELHRANMVHKLQVNSVQELVRLSMGYT